MLRVIVQRSILYGEIKLVLAHDEQERQFVGMWLNGAEPGRFMFIQIDESTALDLQRGTVSLYTVILERSVGLVFEAGLDAIDVDARHLVRGQPDACRAIEA